MWGNLNVSVSMDIVDTVLTLLAFAQNLRASGDIYLNDSRLVQSYYRIFQFDL